MNRETAESLVLLSYGSQAAAEAMASNIRGNAENQRAVGLDLMELLEVPASQRLPNSLIHRAPGGIG